MNLTLFCFIAFATLHLCSSDITIYDGQGQTQRPELKIGCENGMAISIKSAVYGRKDKQGYTCGLDGTCRKTDMKGSSETVHKPKAVVDIVEKFCKDRQNCRFPVTPRIFGKLCPNVPKHLKASYKYHLVHNNYLQVEHECVKKIMKTVKRNWFDKATCWVKQWIGIIMC